MMLGAWDYYDRWHPSLDPDQPMAARTAILAVLIAAAAAGPAMRLIEFNETSRVWMSAAEVDKLVFSPTWHNFIDVTDAPAPILNRAIKAEPFPTQPTQKVLVEQLVANIDTASMLRNLQTISSFFTRYYQSDTGVQAAEWVYSELVAIKGARDDITVTLFRNTFKQPSVIARIEGAHDGPAGIVILGSHIDSVGASGTSQAPGADDDGSGTICNLEAFRVIVEANIVLERSIEFHYYAGEEAGLLGSQAIANDYSNKGVDVYAMLQLDMTMYPGSSPAMSPITDFTNADLTSFLHILIDTYCSIGYTDSRCGYGCSDHASWYRTGVPSAMPFETVFNQHNPYIHSARDIIDHLDLNHGKQFVILAIAHLVELGNTVPTA
eukprot:m.60182 g.60182  ORF g.60182 m.60182 type:complete len:380 (+) comp7011_c0_seq3:102-1241(+)